MNLQRNGYLVAHSFRSYMIAAILTMAAMNLNSILDGILMGNLLGADALSAINVFLPVVSCISAVGILLTQGCAIRIAKFLGAMKRERANQVFTVSVTSLLAVALVISVIAAATNLAVPLTRLLRPAPELVDLVEKYAGVLLPGALFLILQNGLSALINVMGRPKIVTITMVIAMCTNILFDIVNIKVFGMGIAGSAYATVLAALISDIVFIGYILKHSGIKLCRCPEYLKDLGIGVATSLPGLIGTLSAVALMFICNHYIMSNQGADGMFVMSIGYSLVSIGSMISNGVGMSYTAIGGMLVGQGDYFGLRALFRRGLTVAVLSPVVFNILGLFSGTLAHVFGADTPAKLELARHALPLVCTLLFALGIVSSTLFMHVVLGHQVLSTVNSVTIIASVWLSFIAAQSLLPPEKIWYAFPCASVLGLLILFADTTLVRKRSGERLQMLSLIPEKKQEGKLFDISVACDMKSKDEAMDALIGFMKENGADELENSVVHCMDELMMNVINFSGSPKGSYMDLSVLIWEKAIKATLRNTGQPFDPVRVAEEDKKYGLKIVSHYCKQMEYRYSFGQNIVLASWDR